MSAVSSQLIRLCRSVPLLNLPQGGTLTIHSILPQTQFIICPEWRNDGHIKLEHRRRRYPHDGVDVVETEQTEVEANMIVQQQSNKVTSLGRSEAHVSVRLEPKMMQAFPNNIQHNRHHQQLKIENVEESNSFFGEKVMLDDGTVVPDSAEWKPPPDGMIRVDYNDGIAHVRADDKNDTVKSSISLTANIPEKLNLTCEAQQGGSILVNHKVEGDSRLVTTDGDVRVRKLRGHQLFLETKTLGSVIHASDLLEAQHLQVLTRGRFRAQRIQGDHVQIEVDNTHEECSSVEEMTTTTTPNMDPAEIAVRDTTETRLLDDHDRGAIIDISALYTSAEGGANLSVTSLRSSTLQNSMLCVKSNHGHIQVKAVIVPSKVDAKAAPDKDVNYPIVQLGGVNGSFDVAIDIQEEGHTGNMLAGRIHIDSLSPNSVSFVASNHGDLILSVDRNVDAEFRLLSADNAVSLRECLLTEDATERSNALRALDQQQPPHESESSGRVSNHLKHFTPSQVVSLQHCQFVEGWLQPTPHLEQNKSDRVVGGKIRLDAAANQALHTFDSGRKGEGEYPASRPLVIVLTKGKIAVEALSWKDSIARRFGIEETTS